MLQKMLEKLSFTVASVESAEDALEYLKINALDIIFMDHMMPGMDGFDAVKAIKAEPQIGSIPIVVHTTKRGDIYVGQARALGAADILAKPASIDDIKAVLARIEQHKAEREAALALTSPHAVIQLDDDESEPLLTGNYQAIHTVEVPVVDEPALLVPRANHNPLRQLLVVLLLLLPVLWLIGIYIPAEHQRKELLTQRNYSPLLHNK